MKSCPPVTVNVDEVVEAAKVEVLKGCPSLKSGVSADVHSVGVRGLGKIALIEPKVSVGHFAVGYVTIPSVVNFATKLMQLGIILPQADLGVSRGIAAGATLLATLLSGGKSFLLGAFLGQFPTTVDTLTDVAIKEIVAARADARVTNVPVTAPAETKGIGSTEEEIVKLRQDLQRLQGVGSARGARLIY